MLKLYFDGAEIEICSTGSSEAKKNQLIINGCSVIVLRLSVGDVTSSVLGQLLDPVLYPLIWQG